MWFNSLYFFLLPELTMASNKGLNEQEILDKLDKLDKLFADDHEKHVVAGIGVDAQSDAEEADTEYEDDSEDEDPADFSDPLQFLSCGLAPVMQPADPDNQVAGPSSTTSIVPRLSAGSSSTVPRLSDLPTSSSQAAGPSSTVPRLSDLPRRSSEVAGSSRGITGSPTTGWRPDIPSMPVDPSELSPYPSRRSEQRDPPTPFDQHLESLHGPLDIPADETTPSAALQPADPVPSSQARLSSIPKLRVRSVPAKGHQNQHTLRLARLTAESSAKRPRPAPTSGSEGSDDMFPPSPAPAPAP